MATRQASVEKKRASAKDRLAKHRDKIYSNPELLEEYRRKERERYQKRKESGKIKTTQDLTKKQHEKKKKQWRKNSAEYYRRKTQEQALLDLTPASSASETENSSANAETRQEVDLNCDNLNETPSAKVNLTGPTEASTPKRPWQEIKKRERQSKLVRELRAKIRYAEEKDVAKAKELEKMKRRMKRLEARRQPRAMPRPPAVISERARKATKGLPNNSKRRQLGKVVSTFLHRDDVSTVINGRFGEIRRKGQIYRKRALTDTLANLHRQFCAEHPETHLSKAQFFKLRPFWIVRPKVQDRETCACKIHENIGLKVKKLKQLGIIETASPDDLVQSSVCDVNNLSCMYGTCQNCMGKTFPTSLDPLTQGNIVTWKEWATKSVNVSKKRVDGSTEEKEVKNTLLENKNCSIEKLLALTTEHLPRFAVHLFNIRHQFRSIKFMKETLPDDAVAVHVDYSENYSCKYSKEIKETHFGKGNEQVTLHTGVIYLSRGRVEAFASLSPCLQHDAVATWAHLNPVLRTIREKHPEVKTIHFISDGPTSQYRNRTAFYLASTVPFLHGFQWVTWNYTEASHGKGAPDGVGGALKNLADRIVSYGTSIPDADSLYEQLKNNSSVTLYKVTVDEITASSELVPPKVKSVPGTMKIHQLTSTKPGVINTRPVSCFCEKDCHCFSLESHTLSEGGAEGPDGPENPGNTMAYLSVQSEQHPEPNPALQVLQDVEIEMENIVEEPRPKPKQGRHTKKEDPCDVCHVCGDTEDSRRREVWRSCTGCKRSFHKTCAKENGVLYDNDSYSCMDCLLVPLNFKKIPGTSVKLQQLTSTKPGVISTENPRHIMASPSVVQAEVHPQPTPELQVLKHVMPELAMEMEMEAETPDSHDLFSDLQDLFPDINDIFVIVEDIPQQPQVPVTQGATRKSTAKGKGPRPKPKQGRHKKKEDPCAVCHYIYGDTEDPRMREEWQSCTGCKRWYHETCAKENGVLYDNGSFTCIDCSIANH